MSSPSQEGSPAGVKNRWVLCKIRCAVLEFQNSIAEYSIQHRLETSMNAMMKKFIEPAPEVSMNLEQGLVLCPACARAPAVALPQPVNPDEPQPSAPPATAQPIYRLKIRVDLPSYLSVDRADSEPFDMYEQGDDIVLLFEMCGASGEPTVRRRLAQTERGHTWMFTVEAERRAPVPDNAFLHQERRYGRVRREVPVPFHLVDPALPLQAWADGVLSLRFKKLVVPAEGEVVRPSLPCSKAA